MQLQFTLVSEGASDRVLLPVIRWALREAAGHHTYEGRWPDLRKLRKPPRSLTDKVRAALHLEPCDLLFVHRDADCPDATARRVEILEAVKDARDPGAPPAVCVVPIQMSEAWFLFDEMAIRRAAGNPRGKMPLELPRLGEVEVRADPKAILQAALRTASYLPARRRSAFDVGKAYHLVANSIDDFSPLRQLRGFQVFESDVRAVMHERKWI